MDCRESRELMSGAVDDQLATGESSGFFGHIEICGSCRDEFELEKLTKSYLKRKMTFVDVPDDVERVIMDRITSMDPQTAAHSRGSGILGNSLIQPLLAVGIVLIVAIILFFTNMSNVIMPGTPHPPGEHESLSQQDILTLVESNFQNVLDGQFKPQITALALSDVASFLAQNAGYSMKLPSVPAADWIGGSVSQLKNEKVCQIVYKMGETYIYIYGLPKQALDSRIATLPPNCLLSLQAKKRYWTMDGDGDVQVVWDHDGHICIATSNLGRTDLSGYLNTSNRPVVQ